MCSVAQHPKPGVAMVFINSFVVDIPDIIHVVNVCLIGLNVHVLVHNVYIKVRFYLLYTLPCITCIKCQC